VANVIKPLTNIINGGKVIKIMVKGCGLQNLCQ